MQCAPAGYKANLVAAADSDARLEARLGQNQTKFNALSLDLAISQMPRLQACTAHHCICNLYCQG